MLIFLNLEFYKDMSNELASILKPEDINSYQAFDLPILKHNFTNFTIITSNQGTGGPILLDVLRMINNTNTYQNEVSFLNAFKGKVFNTFNLLFKNVYYFLGFFFKV